MTMPIRDDRGRPAPQAGGQPISDAVADQAAQWLTLLMSGEAGDADRQRWQQWRAAHPDHDRAWRHIEAVTGRLQRLEPAAARKALSSHARPRSPARRNALNLVLAGVAAGGAGLLATRTPAWRRQMADNRTATGERRTLVLEDGTQVTLNTASAIDVRFDERIRLLRLVEGEAFIVTGHAGGTAARPFVVETGEGRIRALGTRFGVRQHAGRSTVAVQESAVEIAPASGLAPRILEAGQCTAFTRTSIELPQPLAEGDDAWLRGQIVAGDMPLGEFAAELSRYRPGLLRCDPAVADLRVSGVFPLADTDRILAALPGVLPVRVRQRTRWWVVIEAAG